MSVFSKKLVIMPFKNRASFFNRLLPINLMRKMYVFIFIRKFGRICPGNGKLINVSYFNSYNLSFDNLRSLTYDSVVGWLSRGASFTTPMMVAPLSRQVKWTSLKAKEYL